MKILISLFIFILITSCSTPKTVLVCGDHVCVNKAEADQYFEDNLTIEVKIIKKKNDEEVDLVRLNLKEGPDRKKKISISSIKKTNKKLKTLSNNDVKKIKEKIKSKKKKKKIAQKIFKTEIKTSPDTPTHQKSKNLKQNVTKSDVNKKEKDIVDVCTIVEKCSIDEIAKYLLKQGKKKNFPDITSK